MELVKKVDKVTHVYNELTIAAPSSLVSRSSDSYITTKVKTQLFADKNVSGIQFKVVTEKGVVYLMGIVSRAEAEIATDIARQTGGVQKVVKLFQYTD
jgi:osmotically-inducible protein OsmY